MKKFIVALLATFVLFMPTVAHAAPVVVPTVNVISQGGECWNNKSTLYHVVAFNNTSEKVKINWSYQIGDKVYNKKMNLGTNRGTYLNAHIKPNETVVLFTAYYTTQEGNDITFFYRTKAINPRARCLDNGH